MARLRTRPVRLRSRKARAADNAESDLARKLRLEAALSRRLDVLDREVVKEFERVLAKRGTIMGTTQVETITAAILKEHGFAVARAFSARLRVLMPNANAITNQEDATIALVLQEFVETQSTRQAQFITSTTRGNMARAIEVVNAEAGAAGEALGAVERASRSAGLLRRNLAGRHKGIATFETQNVAEAAKLTEAEVLSGIEPTVRSGRSEAVGIGRRWDSQGDSVVRPTHLEADSQVVDMEEPFLVGGFKLMYPSDRSLGAPLSETAGCRCSARYDKDAIIERRQQGAETP